MSKHKPRISVCIPMHDMENGNFFADRITKSLEKQTFRDFEVIVTREGKMAENSNAAIKKAKGEIVKILYMDDYFYSEDALKRIDEAFQAGAKWAVSGCVHDDTKTIFNPHYPVWDHRIYEGQNTIGSPSVLAFINDDPLLFDETMDWTLDMELYCRLKERYGEPTIINFPDVAIGIGEHQMTNKITPDQKRDEESRFFYKHHLV